MLTLINHKRCNPKHHRATADENLNEHHVDGMLTCQHCGKPMFFCGRAAEVNTSEPGYQLTYLHDTNDPERCT